MAMVATGIDATTGVLAGGRAQHRCRQPGAHRGMQQRAAAGWAPQLVLHVGWQESPAHAADPMHIATATIKLSLTRRFMLTSRGCK
jgi:hypothetical protein